eukprot:4133454-Prymnesium_polylepis.1
MLRISVNTNPTLGAGVDVRKLYLNAQGHQLGPPLPTTRTRSVRSVTAHIGLCTIEHACCGTCWATEAM